MRRRRHLCDDDGRQGRMFFSVKGIGFCSEGENIVKMEIGVDM